jgi:rhodanese-related sulfurtransferase
VQHAKRVDGGEDAARSFMIHEITVTELSDKLKSGDHFILLDVREPHELNFAKVSDSRLEVTPMSRLAREGTKALSELANSKESTIYVMCHHGNRSAQVTAWLAQQGWKNVFNVRGGIDEYAREVDQSVGFY